MHLVPLCDASASPDGWHQVAAPGGYECWHFDAQDTTGDLRLVVDFFDGCIFHPGYLRSYARYRSRPTRVAPPLPQNYRCVQFVLYRAGAVLSRFTTQHDANRFAASPERPEVTIGPSGFAMDPDGSLELSFAGESASADQRQVAGTLTFSRRAAAPAKELLFPPAAVSAGFDHRWITAASACQVRGALSLSGGASAEAAEEITFHGRGYQDHRYGTAPVGLGVKRWISGRILADDGLTLFQHLEPIARGRPGACCVIELDANGRRESMGNASTIRSTRRTPLGLTYPEQLGLLDRLQLQRPQLIDAGLYSARVSYTATTASGAEGIAFCEIVFPQRLRWPVIGRMIEQSFVKAGKQ